MENRIIDFINKISLNKISQHSAEWHTARQLTIGGSSIATVMGLYPYSNIPKLLEERVGLVPNKSSIQMQWGSLFEDVLKKYVEIDAKCSIYGDNCYITGYNQCISYSPDGLAVINLANVDSKLPSNEKMVLLEFKCPFSRIPTSKMPKYYIPQVKMGLDVIDFLDCGLFVEAVIRRCSMDDFNYSQTHDYQLHKKINKMPLAIGLIGFHTLSMSNEYSCEDFGKCDVDTITQIFDQYNKKNICANYLNLSVNNNVEINVNDETVKYKRYCEDNNYNYIGVLPYKIYTVNYHTIDRTDNYLAEWIPNIEQIIEVIKQCKDKSYDEKRTILYRHYCNVMHGDY